MGQNLTFVKSGVLIMILINHITFIFFGAKENETKETGVVDEIKNFIEKYSFSDVFSAS